MSTLKHKSMAPCSSSKYTAHSSSPPSSSPYHSSLNNSNFNEDVVVTAGIASRAGNPRRHSVAEQLPGQGRIKGDGCKIDCATV